VKRTLLIYVAGLCAGMAALTKSTDDFCVLLLASCAIMTYIGYTTPQPRTP